MHESLQLITATLLSVEATHHGGSNFFFVLGLCGPLSIARIVSCINAPTVCVHKETTKLRQFDIRYNYYIFIFGSISKISTNLIFAQISAIYFSFALLAKLIAKIILKTRVIFSFPAFCQLNLAQSRQMKRILGFEFK